MRRYWVYMVLCGDGSYYVGIINNVELRVAQHNDGLDPHCYTFLRRPVSLVYTAEFDQPNKAIAWEKHLKGWSRGKKEALVASNWAELKRLSHWHESN